MRRRIIGWIVKLVGIVFIVAGLAIFLYPNMEEWKTSRDVASIEQSIEQSREAAIGQVDKTESDSDNSEQTDRTSKTTENLKQTIQPELYQALLAYNQKLLTDGQNIRDVWDYEQPPVDFNVLNDGSAVIGYIEIPDMKIKLPLYLGASMDNLAEGAAVMSQTSMPIGGLSTNTVIAGHRGYRGRAFFQRIEDLQIGSRVFVTNPWETLTYEVKDVKIVDPNTLNDILIQKEKDLLTLVTCHPYMIGGGPERYLVFCERVESTAVDTDSDESDKKAESKESPSVVSEDKTERIVESEYGMLKLEQMLRILFPMLILFFVCATFIAYVIRKKRSDDMFQ